MKMARCFGNFKWNITGITFSSSKLSSRNTILFVQLISSIVPLKILTTCYGEVKRMREINLKSIRQISVYVNPIELTPVSYNYTCGMNA
jgi:hypothetical protein